MISRTTKEEIQRYYENSAMNQSLLKTLVKGPHAFVQAQQEPERKLYYQEKGHFIIGSAVDCYLTQGEEEFKSQYHIPDNKHKKPGEKIMSILQMAFDKAREEFGNIEVGFFTTESWQIILHVASDANEYYMNRRKDDYKLDNRKETIFKDGGSLLYLADLIDAQGKQILSEDESNIINGIIMSLTTQPYIKNYFVPANNNVDIIFQLPIYFTYKWQNNKPLLDDINKNNEILVKKGLSTTPKEFDYKTQNLEKPDFEEHEEDCKALLDVLLIDHEAKTIQPCDVKTTEGDCYWFLSKVKSYEYQIQAAYYTEAIEQWKKFPYQEFPYQDKDISDYTILPFKFIVESTNLVMQGNPLVFKCTENLLELGRTGRSKMFMMLQNDLVSSDIVNGDYVVYNEIKGIEQLFNDYIYYKENGFNKRREIMEGNHFELDYHEITPIEFISINNL